MTKPTAPSLALTVCAAVSTAVPSPQMAWAQMEGETVVPSLTDISLETIRARDESLLRDLAAALMERHPDLVAGTEILFTRVESFGTVFYRMDIQGIEDEARAREICKLLEMERCLVARPGASVLASPGPEAFDLGPDGLVDMSAIAGATTPAVSGSVEEAPLPTQGAGWSPVEEVRDVLSDLPLDRPDQERVREGMEDSVVAVLADAVAQAVASQVASSDASPGSEEAGAGTEAGSSDPVSGVWEALSSTLASDVGGVASTLEQGAPSPQDGAVLDVEGLDAALEQARASSAMPVLALDGAPVERARPSLAPSTPPVVSVAVAGADGVPVPVEGESRSEADVAALLDGLRAPAPTPAERPQGESMQAGADPLPGDRPTIAVAQADTPRPQARPAGLSRMAEALPSERPEEGTAVVEAPALRPVVETAQAETPRPMPRPQGLGPATAVADAPAAQDPDAVSGPSLQEQALVAAEAAVPPPASVDAPDEEAVGGPVAQVADAGTPRPRPRPGTLAEEAAPSVTVADAGMPAVGESSLPKPVWEAGPRPALGASPAREAEIRAPIEVAAVAAQGRAEAGPLGCLPHTRPQEGAVPVAERHALAARGVLEDARLTRAKAAEAAFARFAEERARSSAEIRRPRVEGIASPAQGAAPLGVMPSGVEVALAGPDTPRPMRRPGAGQEGPTEAPMDTPTMAALPGRPFAEGVEQARAGEPVSPAPSEPVLVQAMAAVLPAPQGAASLATGTAALESPPRPKARPVATPPVDVAQAGMPLLALPAAAWEGMEWAVGEPALPVLGEPVLGAPVDTAALPVPVALPSVPAGAASRSVAPSVPVAKAADPQEAPLRVAASTPESAPVEAVASATEGSVASKTMPEGMLLRAAALVAAPARAGAEGDSTRPMPAVARLRGEDMRPGTALADGAAVLLASYAAPSERVVGQDVALPGVADAQESVVAAALVVQPPAVEVPEAIAQARPKPRPLSIEEAARALAGADVEGANVDEGAVLIAAALPETPRPKLRPQAQALAEGGASAGAAAPAVVAQAVSPRRVRMDAVPVSQDDRPIHGFLAVLDVEMPVASSDVERSKPVAWGPVADAWAGVAQEAETAEAKLWTTAAPMPFAVEQGPASLPDIDALLAELKKPGTTFRAPPVVDFAALSAQTGAAAIAGATAPVPGVDPGIAQRVAQADAMPGSIRATVGEEGVVMATDTRRVVVPKRPAPASRFAVALTDTYAMPFDLAGTGVLTLQRLPMARPAVVEGEEAVAAAEAEGATLIAAVQEEQTGLAGFFPEPSAADAALPVPDAFAEGQPQAEVSTPADAPVSNAGDGDPALAMMARLRGGLDGTLEALAIPTEAPPAEAVAEATGAMPAPGAAPRPVLNVPPLEVPERPQAEVPLATVAQEEATAPEGAIEVAAAPADAPVEEKEEARVMGFDPVDAGTPEVPFATSSSLWPDEPVQTGNDMPKPSLVNPALMINLSYAPSPDEVTGEVHRLMRLMPPAMLERGQFYGAAAPASPGLYIVGIQARSVEDRDALVAYMTTNGIPFVLPGQPATALLER